MAGEPADGTASHQSCRRTTSHAAILGRIPQRGRGRAHAGTSAGGDGPDLGGVRVVEAGRGRGLPLSNRSRYGVRGHEAAAGRTTARTAAFG